MLLFAFFLLTAKTKNKLPNQLFFSFLILSIFDISSLFKNDYIEPSLHFEVFRMASSLLIVPLLYLYTKAVCYSDFKLKPKHLWLSMPFLISNLVFIPRFYLSSVDNINFIYEHFKQMFEIRFFYMLRELQYIFYLLAILNVLKKYKAIYIENYTDLSNSSYRWLLQMTGVLFVSHCLLVLKFLPEYVGNPLMIHWLNVMIAVCAILISSWFVLKALRNPELFKGVDSSMIALNEELKVKPVNSSRALLDTRKSAEMELQINRIKKYVLENELYLDPSLTIQELSRQIVMPVRDLSLLINRHSNQHFFDFINEFRIEKAKQLIKDPSNRQLTILEILYQVGFNSKSSFNTAFKKFTGQTPTEYRLS